MLQPDNPNPFTLTEYAFYLSAIVKAIPELHDQRHSPYSFLEAIQRHLEDYFQMAPQVSAVFDGDTEAISPEKMLQFHQAVFHQVFDQLP